MKMALVRERLHAVATHIHYRGLTEYAKEIHFLAEETRRRKYLRRKVIGPKDKEKLTPAIRKYIRVLRHEQNMSYADIGKLTGVTNVGRLSEVCEGKRQ